eukprot:6104720-Prymnesium_polylepis.2
MPAAPMKKMGFANICTFGRGHAILASFKGLPLRCTTRRRVDAVSEAVRRHSRWPHRVSEHPPRPKMSGQPRDARIRSRRVEWSHTHTHTF